MSGALAEDAPAAEPAAFHRVLVKLSGESLMGEAAYGIDPERVAAVAKQLGRLTELGIETAVVVGAGNIYRGMTAAAVGMERATADYAGMLATLLNCLAVQDALERDGVDTRILSALTVSEVAEPYIRRRAIRHLEKGRVVIFAAGTGNPFFTTDTAAALRALEIGAEGILMGKNGVDGVYDADPKTHPEAVKFDALTYDEFLARGLKVADATSVSLSRDNDISMIVFNLSEEGNILRVVEGEKIGTTVSRTV